MTLGAAECAKGVRDRVEDQRDVPWLTKPQGLGAKVGGRIEELTRLQDRFGSFED